MAKSPCPGIAVYPEGARRLVGAIGRRAELAFCSLSSSLAPSLFSHPPRFAFFRCAGHRSTRPESLSLKRGMLRYAYSRSIPVQVVHGYNKESILSEKQFLARFGQTVAVGYSRTSLMSRPSPRGYRALGVGVLPSSTRKQTGVRLAAPRSGFAERAFSRAAQLCDGHSALLRFPPRSRPLPSPPLAAVIDTATFDTFEEFLAVVQDTWDSLWKEVFSTDMESASARSHRRRFGSDVCSTRRAPWPTSGSRGGPNGAI